MVTWAREKEIVAVRHASLLPVKGEGLAVCPVFVFVEKLSKDDLMLTSFVVKRRPNNDF